MGTIEGYLAGQIFNLAPLALAFFSILACANAIAGAEERGAMDILLGNPIPRWQLVAGNFIVAALSTRHRRGDGRDHMGHSVLVGCRPLAPGECRCGPEPLADVRLLRRSDAAVLLPLAREVAVTIPAVALFAMSLPDALGRVSEEIEDFRPASLFYYYGSAIEDGLDWGSFDGIVTAALVLVLLAALAFRRREIYA